MKTSIFLIIFTLSTCVSIAQTTAPKLKTNFYGFVRGDASFDSRESVTAFEGLFLLYPADRLEDANGKDLNAEARSGFYAFNSRAGVDVSGLNLFNADLSARLEADFAGFSGANGNSSILRIRLAYIKMQWQRFALTVGQQWHPMFSPVAPDVISLSVGAPFQPFNRSPMVLGEYRFGSFTLAGAAIYQFQFTSAGPNGKSNLYQRHGALPEFHLGLTYADKGFTAGLGANTLTIEPRERSIVGENTYKVKERLGTFSYTAFLKYAKNRFTASARTVYGANLSHQTMLGGYGINAIDEQTGERDYTPFRHTTTWFNITYGQKYRAGVFAGYTKNLGTDKALLPDTPTFGDGLALNELYRLAGTLTYNVPHFSLGLEYEMTAAAYGDPGTFNAVKGRYDASHTVTNHRLVAVISYLF